MPENPFSLTTALGTESGVRPINQDGLLSVVPQDARVMASKGALFVVADGFETLQYSGQEERVSQIVVNEIGTAYYQEGEENILNALVLAVKQADVRLHQLIVEYTRNPLSDTVGYVRNWGRFFKGDPSNKVGGSACAAVVFCGAMAYGANVEADRVYLMRHEQLKLLSPDHTFLGEQVRKGLLTPEQARLHYGHGVVRHPLGDGESLGVDTFVEPVQDGDTWVVCTDGLHYFVTDEELSAIIGRYQPRESVKRLILLAKKHGGDDDITVIVVKVSLRESREK
jgi:serine/threonine protein phosphatase PrpC